MGILSAFKWSSFHGTDRHGRLTLLRADVAAASQSSCPQGFAAEISLMLVVLCQHGQRWGLTGRGVSVSHRRSRTGCTGWAEALLHPIRTWERWLLGEPWDTSGQVISIQHRAVERQQCPCAVRGVFTLGAALQLLLHLAGGPHSFWQARVSHEALILALWKMLWF